MCAACGLDTERVERVLRRLKERSQGKDWRFRKTLAALVGRLGEAGMRPGRMWEADHVVPLAIGGHDTLENLRTLCIPCHKPNTARLAAHRARRRRLKLANFPQDWVP